MKQFSTFILLCALALGGCASATREEHNTILEMPAVLTERVWTETQRRTTKVFRNWELGGRSDGAGTIFRHRNQIYVLTALHVAMTSSPRSLELLAKEQSDSKISIELFDGTRVTPEATVLFPDYDLAILGPIPGSKAVAALRLENYEYPNEQHKPGLVVIAWGTPHGFGPSPVLGRITGYAPMVRPGIGKSAPHRAFLFTAGIQPGHSGGPTFDLDGRLLGIVNFGGVGAGGVPDGSGAGVLLSSVWGQLIDGIDTFPWATKADEGR